MIPLVSILKGVDFDWIWISSFGLSLFPGPGLSKRIQEEGESQEGDRDGKMI